MFVSSNVHTNSRLDRPQGIRQTPMKVTNKVPMTVPKEMEIHELLDKSFRIIILKKLSVLQEKIYNYMQSGKQHMNKIRDSLMAQTVKHLPTERETWVQSLGWEDPLGKEMATHSSTLAWKIPWTEEPGRLQCMNTYINEITFLHLIVRRCQSI